MKKAIYLRKSRGSIKDLEKHKRQLLKLCEKNNWKYDLYEEIASSEKFEERKELTKLIDNIAYYDGVICIHMDRLSRNELHQALITQILKENNVKVITLSKVYDFNKENDMLLGDFEKLIARQELRLTKTRLRRGKVSAFEKGLWVNGFPPMPYIYNKETKSLEIDEEKLLEFNRIKSLALKGDSCNLIAEKMGTNSTKIKRILKSKVGLGYTKYKGEYKKGNHTPVITLEEYKEIANSLLKRTNGIRKTKHKYMFSELIYCKCGYKRTITKFNNKEGVIKCRNCGDSGMLVNGIDRQISMHLKKYRKNIASMINNIEVKDKKIELMSENEYLELKIKKEFKKEENIKKMMINDLLTFEDGNYRLKNISKIKENLKGKKLIIQTQLKNLEKSKEKKSLVLKEIKIVLENNITQQEVNIIYKTIIEKIIVENKKVMKIIYK